MTSVWLPTYGHPLGPSRDPWFVVDDVAGRRAATHPYGASEDVVFRVSDALVYLASRPEEPHFEIVGSFAYLAGSSGAPWYWIRPAEQVSLHRETGG